MPEQYIYSQGPELTILIPHYKTLELSKLCLRSIKLFTDLDKVKVIVIDNDSNDQSLEYLRSINWIKLIERKDIAAESPAKMHAKALDLGMEHVKTKYVLSIHTDTIVTSSEWLSFLFSRIKEADDIAGIGSWKLEHKPWFKSMAKRLEHIFQTKIWFPLTRRGSGAIVGLGDNHYYLRSHCALYQTELIRKIGWLIISTLNVVSSLLTTIYNKIYNKVVIFLNILITSNLHLNWLLQSASQFRKYTDGFFDSGETAGKALHRKLIEKGYQMSFIPTEKLGKYMKHLNHATMILNPEIAGKRTGKPKAYKRIMKELKSVGYDRIIKNNDLD